MDKSHSGREHIDPRLLALIDRLEERESLDISGLQKDDVVSVQTRNTVYTMRVVNPQEGRVLVNSNGRHITQETEGAIVGTTLTGTGTMVKLRTIILGMRLCIWAYGIGELILSATQEVRVNGSKVLPLDKSQMPN